MENIIFVQAEKSHSITISENKEGHLYPDRELPFCNLYVCLPWARDDHRKTHSTDGYSCSVVARP